MHWTNVVALTILLMSGLQIFNAHPNLYWAGKSSYTGAAPVLAIGARQSDELGRHRHDAHLRPRVQHDRRARRVPVGRRAIVGAGIPVVDDDSRTTPGCRWRGPGISSSRGCCSSTGWSYVAYGAASRHLARDLAPDRNDWRSIGRSIRDHLRFRHPTGEAAKRYNVLQKLAYLVVIFVLLPLIILMGIAMSPWMNSALPGWVDLFGGRQAARTLHFVAAWLLVAFVAIHVFEVIVSGLWNHLRSMITGRYRIHAERAP